VPSFPFRFGVNEFTTQPWTFEQDIENYRALGVDSIEICEAKLDPNRIDEQMRMVQGSGLHISAVQPKIRTFFASRMAPEPKPTEARIEALTHSLKTLAPYAPGAPFVINTGAPTADDMADGNMHAIMDQTITHLRNLCPLAADLGVTLALEPLNPTSMNIETAIWTVDQAMDIIDAVNHPAMGLCLDFWNIWQEDDIEAQIARAAEKITVLQVSDWRTPRSTMDRLIPGDGHIPLGHLLHATADAGFTGTCTVEIFSSNVPDSLYKKDPHELIRQSRAALERAWNDTH